MATKKPSKGKPSAKKTAKGGPAKKAKTAAPRTASRAKAPGWMDAGKGYELGIRDGAIKARKNGEDLASVPKALKAGTVGERLVAAVDFLEDHERQCLATVETWMLRSLPVPRKVLESVLVDDYWQKVLRDAWVVPVGTGDVNREAGGFFRGVDAQKGIGVVDRGGETAWLDTEMVMIPHPVLLDEVDDLRQLAVEIGATQGLSQLFRETFVVPKAAPADPMNIDSYTGGEFSMLSQVIGLAKRLGYRVSGGASVCRVLERGKFVEARYDIGGDGGDPMYETTTGDLTWVDDKQKPIGVVDVPPVAFSEGMRMAAQIYAKRKIEKDGDE